MLCLAGFWICSVGVEWLLVERKAASGVFHVGVAYGSNGALLLGMGLAVLLPALWATIAPRASSIWLMLSAGLFMVEAIAIPSGPQLDTVSSNAAAIVIGRMKGISQGLANAASVDGRYPTTQEAWQRATGGPPSSPYNDREGRPLPYELVLVPARDGPILELPADAPPGRILYAVTTDGTRYWLTCTILLEPAAERASLAHLGDRPLIVEGQLNP